MNTEEKQLSILEQHIGTILQIMVIGLLGWSLTTTVDMRTDMGIMKAKMEAVQTALAQGTNDRYRAADAARDFKAVWDEVARIESRITRCEGKLTK
jgi:hypothetical protein